MSDPGTFRKLTGLERRLHALETVERPRTNYGSANPTGWPNNVPFFRTDLGWWIYYDGTRWLTECSYQLTVSEYQNLGTGSPQATAPRNVRFDFAVAVSHVTIHTRVTPTNTAINYWDVTLQALNGDLSAATTVYTFNTAGDGAIMIRRNVAPSTPIPTNRDWFRLFVGKTGTPSGIEIAGSIYYRLIIP